MVGLQKFLKLSQQFSDVADFAIVYIEEAHALDEWAFDLKDGFKIYQHRSIEERIQAADLLTTYVELGKTKLLIDTMDNNINELYAALPERLYILCEGTLAYVGGVGPFFYDVAEVETWLVGFQRESQPSRTRGALGNFQIDPRIE